MIKETGISLYLLLVRQIFTVCRFFGVKNKTVMLASFGDNIQYVIDKLSIETDSNIIILKEPKCGHCFKNINSDAVISFTPKSPLSFFKGIFHLATSRVVFVDNYHVVLAACRFESSVTCVQLWHANGAVKQFGLKDKAIGERKQSALRRFNAVYDRFNKVVVSSDNMAEIFKAAFNKKESEILKTGVPRTDFYFNTEAVSRASEKIKASHPQIQNKTVLLYAPTYRMNEMDEADIHLDIKKMTQALGESCHLLIRAHPSVSLEKIEDSPFVTDVSNHVQIEDILAVTDILISDYSSTPFEFSILNRPMIFYPYDLEEYQNNTGIWFDYEKYVPGNIARTTEDIIKIIQNKDYHFDKVAPFNEEWNAYADGHSTYRLIHEVYIK